MKKLARFCPKLVSERVNKLPDYDVLLDAREVLCPIPLLKTKQALKKLASGQVLKVLATDPATEKDLRILLVLTQDELVSFEMHQNEFCFLIRKK